MGRLTTSIAMLGLLVAACGAAATPTATPATPAPEVTPAPVVTAGPATTPPTLGPVTAAPTATPIAISAAVAFDGQACTYSGPRDIPRGASMTLSLANTPAATKGSRGAGLVLMRVADGTTWDQAVQSATTYPLNGYVPAWVEQSEVESLSPERAATGNTLRHTMAGNLYYVMCATAPEETDRSYPGALLKVFDQ